MDTKDISQLEEGFKELSKYSDSQFVVINQLQQKIAQLESENRSLKTMLEQNLPSLELIPGDLSLGLSNEQLICETQIYMLKEAAVTRSLTMEETKKLQIFTEVLAKANAKKPMDDQARLSRVDDIDLLKIVQNEST